MPTDDLGSTAAEPPRLVWDLPLRIAHWLLALAVSAAFITDWIGPGAFRIHEVCGVTALALVIFRLAWGFAGTPYSRFTQFVRGPRAILDSLPDLTRAGYRRRAGHTPLGGWMALALLALVGAQATLGLFANDEISHAGPLYAYVTGHLSNRLSTWHVRIANFILGAVALHVAATLYYRIVLGDDLVRPLITGYKRGVGATAPVTRQRVGLALLILAVVAALLGWLLWSAPEASLDL
jgi:cytochrome b